MTNVQPERIDEHGVHSAEQLPQWGQGTAPQWGREDEPRPDLHAGDRREEGAGGWGWVIYAAATLILAATVNIMLGIDALASSPAFGEAQFVTINLDISGWWLLLLGLLQALVAPAVLLRIEPARWTGVALAAINAVIMLLPLPDYVALSLCSLALALGVIYGLIAHGGWTREA